MCAARANSASGEGFNTGIKHDFLCINKCWALREVLKAEPERQGFNTSRRAQQMLMYQKSMFDGYYCIIGEIASKILFTCTYNGAEKHVT